jgi:hypothetical protein
VTNAIDDPRLHSILVPAAAGADIHWREALQRLQAGDTTLTRKSVGEELISAVQRLLIFLGYSTTSRGAYAVDGDFGRGTNRAVAQFQFEHGLTRKITRSILCYRCTYQDAHRRIATIPESRLTVPTLRTMAETAIASIDAGNVLCGSYDEALRQLNDLHANRFLSCRTIMRRYGEMAYQASESVKEDNGVTVLPVWTLAIIRQETAGVVRPRFEQHKLSEFNRKTPDSDFTELRYRAMSQGLGQVLGVNYKRVGAASARTMYTSPLNEQVLFVARFLATAPKSVQSVVAKSRPSEKDFHKLARHYNGPKYADHHYHERIARWFREFQQLLD